MAKWLRVSFPMYVEWGDHVSDPGDLDSLQNLLHELKAQWDELQVEGGPRELLVAAAQRILQADLLDSAQLALNCDPDIEFGDYDSPDTAYDGSNVPQKRQLTGRERDILCRILTHLLAASADRRTNIPIHDSEAELLAEVRNVLDPRRS